MHTKLRSETAVIQEPQFIMSRAEFREASTVVHTSASIVVRADDEFFRPVRDLIEGGCYTVHINQVLEDPNYDEWWYGRFRVTMVQVHLECPGRLFPHYCKEDAIPLGVALGME